MTPPQSAAGSPVVFAWSRLPACSAHATARALREEIADALAEHRGCRRRGLLARRTGDAQQHPAPARGPRRGRDDPSRRHRGGRDHDTTLGELHATCSSSPATPACRSIAESLDDPRGMVHIRDVLGPYHAARAQPKARQPRARRSWRSILPMSIEPRRSASSTSCAPCSSCRRPCRPPT